MDLAATRINSVSGESSGVNKCKGFCLCSPVIHVSPFTSVASELYLTLQCNEQPSRYIKKEPAQRN